MWSIKKFGKSGSRPPQTRFLTPACRIPSVSSVKDWKKNSAPRGPDSEGKEGAGFPVIGSLGRMASWQCACHPCRGVRGILFFFFQDNFAGNSAETSNRHISRSIAQHWARHWKACKRKEKGLCTQNIYHHSVLEWQLLEKKQKAGLYRIQCQIISRKSFINPSNKYLLSAHYHPGTVLGAEDTKMNETFVSDMNELTNQ